MPKKMGRPKISNPNTIKLSIRINQYLSERLENYCEHHQVSKGDVVRRGLEKILGMKKEQPDDFGE